MVTECLHDRAEWVDGNGTFDEYKCLDCGTQFVQYLENSGC